MNKIRLLRGLRRFLLRPWAGSAVLLRGGERAGALDPGRRVAGPGRRGRRLERSFLQPVARQAARRPGRAHHAAGRAELRRGLAGPGMAALKVPADVATAAMDDLQPKGQCHLEPRGEKTVLRLPRPEGAQDGAQVRRIAAARSPCAIRCRSARIAAATWKWWRRRRAGTEAIPARTGAGASQRFGPNPRPLPDPGRGAHGGEGPPVGASALGPDVAPGLWGPRVAPLRALTIAPFWRRMPATIRPCGGERRATTTLILGVSLC